MVRGAGAGATVAVGVGDAGAAELAARRVPRTGASGGDVSASAASDATVGGRWCGLSLSSRAMLAGGGGCVQPHDCEDC